MTGTISRTVKCITAIFAVWICVGFVASAKSALPAHHSDRILVKPRSDVPGQKLMAVHAAFGGRVLRQHPGIGNLQVIGLPPGRTVAEALTHYRRAGLFQYAEPDYQVQTCLDADDPSFLDGTLWGLHNTGQNGGTADADIDAPEAWNTRTDATWFDGVATQTVIVAVIDTGIRYTHADLAANLWISPGEIPGNGIDDDNNGYVDDVHGINAITKTGDPNDDHGHGTHVAGTVGAVGHNGLGVAGVAWRVQLMACKFLDSTGSGYVSDAVTCVDYARIHGATVLNNSWGGGGPSQALQDAIVAAREAGIIFVAAAGNSRRSIDSLAFYPASYNAENVLAVAATDRNDRLANFSNFGVASVELAAPGAAIYSTHNSSDNGYTTLNGTSMATPHVSGALALLRAQFPEATCAELIQRLLAATDELDSLAMKTATGGRLNLHRALTAELLAYFSAAPSFGADPLTVSFSDQSIGEVTSRTWDFGDGTSTSSEPAPTHTFAAGTHVVTLTVSGPGGVSTRSQVIRVFTPVHYAILPETFSWVNTNGMTQLPLIDDGISAPQPLPFPFLFYGRAYPELYVAANGMIGFSSDGLDRWLNRDLPELGAPNATLYPYWDDLNPSFRGRVSIGTTGEAPNRTLVVSWVGIPHFNDGSAATNTFTFQALLFEGSHQIVFQYLEVQPGAPLGEGRSATVGIENETGQLAARHSFDGSTLLSNGEAIRFVPTEEAPVYPPGDVNGDSRVNGADSLLINQVLVGLRATTDPIFQLSRFVNGDVNHDGQVNGGDSLLINQTQVGLRAHVVTSISPSSRISTEPTTVTPVVIHGIGFATNGVAAVTLGAPIHLTLSNVVVQSAETITALIPHGGGIGTAPVQVEEPSNNGAISFAAFDNH